MQNSNRDDILQSKQWCVPCLGTNREIVSFKWASKQLSGQNSLKSLPIWTMLKQWLLGGENLCIVLLIPLANSGYVNSQLFLLVSSKNKTVLTLGSWGELEKLENSGSWKWASSEICHQSETWHPLNHRPLKLWPANGWQPDFLHNDP